MAKNIPPGPGAGALAGHQVLRTCILARTYPPLRLHSYLGSACEAYRGSVFSPEAV